MRVLVVEDEIRLADNIAIAFRDGPGFAVDVSHDGEEALLMCETTEYDLIVLDLMIPKVHGNDVLRTIRAHDNGTPVLILTTISEVRSTIQLLNSGADDHMTKPFDLGELLARARALVRRGKGQRQGVMTFGAITLTPANQTTSMTLLGNTTPMSSRPISRTFDANFGTQQKKPLSRTFEDAVTDSTIPTRTSHQNAIELPRSLKLLLALSACVH